MWVKILLKMALSVTVSQIFRIFYFQLTSKMAAKSGENWNFHLFHRIPLYYPVSQKFARNDSIHYTLWDIYKFFYFPIKSKMDVKSGENCNFSIFNRTPLNYPVGQKFAQIGSRSRPPNVEKIDIFICYTENPWTTLWVKNFLYL